VMDNSLTCAICGSQFTPRANNAKYCGDRCRAEVNRRKVAAAFAATMAHPERRQKLNSSRRKRKLTPEQLEARRERLRRSNAKRTEKMRTDPEYRGRTYEKHREWNATAAFGQFLIDGAQMASRLKETT